MPVLDEATIQRLMDRIEITRATILDYLSRAGLTEGVTRRTIPCPCCETGAVQFAHDGTHTKHIRARCSTAGCVAWID